GRCAALRPLRISVSSASAIGLPEAETPRTSPLASGLSSLSGLRMRRSATTRVLSNYDKGEGDESQAIAGGGGRRLGGACPGARLGRRGRRASGAAERDHCP